MTIMSYTILKLIVQVIITGKIYIVLKLITVLYLFYVTVLFHSKIINLNVFST